MRKRIAYLVVAGLLGCPVPSVADPVPVAAMEQVQRSVYGTPPQQDQAVKRKGDHVMFAEALETLAESRALVRFIDGSGLALGSSTKVLVDDFVFDIDALKGNALLDISVGTLRFATGAMPKGSTVIRTPTATMTLRGTDVTVHVRPSGRTDVVVHEGLVEATNNFTGETTTLAPGQGQTDTELGSLAFLGDLQQFGLNEPIPEVSVAQAAAMIENFTTDAGPDGSGGDSSDGSSGSTGGGGKGGGKGKGGGNAGGNSGGGGGGGNSGGGGNGGGGNGGGGKGGGKGNK
ncbi:FecR family protein [Dongia sp. agr-C8]